MFHLPTPTLVPTLVPTPVTPVFQPRCSTQSNIGQPPEVLDPSNHIITQHVSVADYSSAPANTSPIEHYCNILCIKLPSVNYGQTTSQGGSKKTLYSLEQTERQPKIQRSCLNSLYLASLNWSKLVNVLDVGLTTLSAFKIELLRDSELSHNGEQLLNYFNPALFITKINN